MQYFEQCVRPKKNNNKAKLRPALYVRTIALWIKKVFYRVPILGCFRPSDHCACPFLAFSATVDHKHRRLCTESRKNNVLESRLIFGSVESNFWGQKGHFQKKKPGEAPNFFYQKIEILIFKPALCMGNLQNSLGNCAL
jgi:hypothetical protein